MRFVECKCECGTIKKCLLSSVRNNRSKSCGCLHRELAKKNATKHDLAYHPIAKVWGSMKQRCYNVNSDNYENYGGRGIVMYTPWKENLEVFYDYVSKLENYGKEGYTIDRINNNKGYFPNNIRMADIFTQNNNQRVRENALFLEIDGLVLSLKDASKKYNIKEATLACRYRNGDRGNRLIRPLETCKKIDFLGEVLTFKQMSEKYNLPARSIEQRYRLGKRGKDLISPIFKANTYHIKGEDLTVSEVGKKYGIPSTTFVRRWDAGKRGDELLKRKAS